MNFLSNSAPSAATTFGSIVHDHIAEPCLVDGTAAICKLGHRVEVDGQSHEITTEMVATCQPYLDYVRSQPGTLLVEFTLPIAHIVDEPGAVGTPDAVLLRDDGFSVIDLKTGNNPRNKILAAGNLQLTIYAMAVADYFGFIGNFEHVQLAIVQPRLQHISETEGHRFYQAPQSTPVINSVDIVPTAPPVLNGWNFQHVPLRTNLIPFIEEKYM
jgi:hypothetical protein